MTTQTEALKLAMDFIERTSSYLPTSFDSDGMKIHAMLKEALAQPEQEPVDYEKLAALGWQSIECPICGSNSAQAFPKPEQEPVAFLVYDPRVESQELYFDDELGDTDCCEITPLYTTPPQRKPLTCFDTEKLAKKCGVEWTTRIDKLCKLAIEAAQGIKVDA